MGFTEYQPTLDKGKEAHFQMIMQLEGAVLLICVFRTIINKLLWKSFYIIFEENF